MFLNILSNLALNFCKVLLNFKDFNENINTDQAIAMQVIGCSGFVRHVVDVHSSFLLLLGPE